nr:MAG TPA: hypothetical protein [Caudoviricetes sp.]
MPNSRIIPTTCTILFVIYCIILCIIRYSRFNSIWRNCIICGYLFIISF